jgi:hypothetical protein
MLFIFSTPVLIRHLWQLKAVIFLHLCLILAGLLQTWAEVAHTCKEHIFTTVITSVKSFIGQALGCRLKVRFLRLGDKTVNAL